MRGAGNGKEWDPSRENEGEGKEGKGKEGRREKERREGREKQTVE